MAIGDFYNLTLTVTRPTYTNDAIGGRSDTPAAVGSAVGRVRNLSGTEIEKLGRNTARDWVRAYTSATFTINRLDKIAVSGSDGGYDGNYEVRRVNAPQTSGSRHHWEIDMVRFT